MKRLWPILKQTPGIFIQICFEVSEKEYANAQTETSNPQLYFHFTYFSKWYLRTTHNVISVHITLYLYQCSFIYLYNKTIMNFEQSVGKYTG